MTAANVTTAKKNWVVSLRNLVTWFPTVILPGATGHQLLSAYLADQIDGLSPITWSLFLFANIGALWLGQPRSWLERFQMYCAFGLSALLDFILVVLIVLKT